MNYLRKLFLNVFNLGILSNISEKKSQNYDISDIAFHTTVFHDETGQYEMTLFTLIMDFLKGETVYFISHVYLRKFKTKKVIKQAMPRNWKTSRNNFVLIISMQLIHHSRK